MVPPIILFKDLPFTPSSSQIFYIENEYDTEINDFISEHYHKMKQLFHSIGYEFCYLPRLAEEQNIEARVRYYAPYLSAEHIVENVKSSALVPYIKDEKIRELLSPSFIFGCIGEGDDGDIRFRWIPIPENWANSSDPIGYIEKILRPRSHRCSFISLMSSEEGGSGFGDFLHSLFSSSRNEPVEDKQEDMNCYKCSDIDDSTDIHKVLQCENAFPHTEESHDEESDGLSTEQILRDLRQAVQKLRLEGVSLMAIHEFIDKQEPLSRMVITPDYRIILPDYNNMEIEMGALPKAIYFLYLRYPDGIISKHMPDHYTELLNIYKQLRPNTDMARLQLTITKVINPLGNALNENIARIRKAFVEKFDEHLSNNYIVTGERGQQYSVPIDRTLITWEE